MRGFITAVAFSACCSLVHALTISQINGYRFKSEYAGQAVTGIKGLVTAKGPAGFFLRSTTLDIDPRSSDSIYVYGSAALKNVTVGDIITLNANVSEYRSSVDYLYLTELISAKNITVVSSGNAVKPIVIGESLFTLPPTEQFSSLDNFDIFGLPNNKSQISTTNPLLWPALFGLDFWESLTGELVTIKKPTALSKASVYGDTWVIGNWRSTGKNARGGLTTTDRDSNPEAILIGDPLDGSNNPSETRLGDSLADITGIVTQVYGYYTIWPTKNITILSSRTPDVHPPTTLISSNKCDKLTFGSYNIDNVSPKSKTLPGIADHIVNYMKLPTLIFLQEIQDNNGATDNGVVAANTTLTDLITLIATLSNTTYAYTQIDPENDQDGVEPGGNIRVAYLYNPLTIQLRNGSNPGTTSDANAVLPGPELKFNPGRIAPADPAFTVSRKPLAAAWETLDGRNKFFTVNVHSGSKSGSSLLGGDARPSLNSGGYDREAQATLIAAFTTAILAEDPRARIVVAGDFNEFAFVEPQEVFVAKSGLRDLDVVAGIGALERYTYLFGQSCQQLDHVYVSEALVKGARFEHVHVNSWGSLPEQVSDHDPSVALLNVCE